MIFSENFKKQPVIYNNLICSVVPGSGGNSDVLPGGRPCQPGLGSHSLIVGIATDLCLFREQSLVG